MSKILVFLMCISVSIHANFGAEETEQVHLSDHVEPILYNLKITPDLNAFKFTGKVDIELKVKFSTDVVKLHCKNLEINKYKLYDKISPNTIISNRFAKTDNFCEIYSLQTLNPGSIYILSIEFKGDLKENAKGLYVTSYQTNVEKKWLIATNFYGNHAREAFPCFDEPRFRTPFVISIARKSDQKVISNMPSKEIHAHSGKILVWNSFEVTPPLSTYQVAFVVSEYSSTLETNNLIKIWTRPEMIENVQYALKQTDKILKQMQNFISIPYKASKVDLVVTSADSPQTQMDTWGLFLFTETQLISDEKKSSELQHKIVTNSICRQLARHWFGGQVIPVSWENSWLTEALAGYMELATTTLVEPTWKNDAIFNVEVLQPALWGELTNAQALTSSMKTSSRISNKHELINQFKGASIIRMLEHMISKSSLRSVIHNYLADSQKQNNGLVTAENFYNALKSQSAVDSFPLPPHFSIVDVMKTWIENQGYPLLNVTRNYENGIIEVEQRTFRSSGAPADQNWIIPVSYTTKAESSFIETAPSEWIFTNKTTLSLNVESTDWIIFNLQQTNYYRVNYDKQNWNFLTKQLKENMTKIHFLNRAQLIDDAFSLAFENELHYSIPVKLMNYLPDENEMVPVLSAVFHLDILYEKYEDTPCHQVLKISIQKIIAKQILTNGFKINPSDDHLIQIGKPSILLLACKVGLSICIQNALQEYKTNIGDLSKVQSDLKEVVFCTALRETQDSDQIYETLMALYRKSDIVYEKITILKVLGCTRDENLLKKILSKLFYKEEKMSKLDEDYIYDSVLSSSNGITTTLRFFQERSSQIGKMKDSELQTMKKLLHKLQHKVHTTKHTQILKKLREEFDNNLDENFNIFKELLRRAHSLSSERVKENNKNSAILKPIFYDLLNIPSVYIPPANDSPANAGTASLEMLFLGLYLLYMYQFYNSF